MFSSKEWYTVVGLLRDTQLTNPREAKSSQGMRLTYDSPTYLQLTVWRYL